VWIDPLDGTSDFVKGNLSAVTVLIGLAIDGIPKIGIVHNPFLNNNNDGKGMTIFGIQEHGAFQLDFDSTKPRSEQYGREPAYMDPFKNEEISNDHKISVACSLNHMS